MKILNCIIVDDEPLAIRLIKAHVDQTPELNLLQTFDKAVAALSFLRHHPVDLIFLDIQMPVITGIEFAREVGKKSVIIFTTAYREYAVESYELNVLDYLVKPIIFARFYRAVGKVIASTTYSAPANLAKRPSNTSPLKEEEFRYFNVNKKYVKVYLSDITHVESVKDYVHIFTRENQITTRERISDFAASLPDNFLRIHRSFIVNLQQITAFTAHDVEIGALEIPIGASYKSAVMKRLTGL